MGGVNQFLLRLKTFTAAAEPVRPEVLDGVRNYLDGKRKGHRRKRDPLTIEGVSKVSKACVGLLKWVQAVYEMENFHREHTER